MQIKIDNKVFDVKDTTENLVEAAADNGITIPAPCYRAKKKNGCCFGCAVKVDGELKYACNTKPTAAMEIEVNTEELITLRKKNLKKYQESIASGNHQSCGGSCK